MSTRSVQPTLGPMEMKRVHRERSTVNRQRLTPVNEVDRDREWLGLFPRALGKAGISMTAAAGTMLIGLPQLSAQCQPLDDKHLSFRRMRRLPPEFWRELIVLIAEFHDITIGGTQQDAEDARVGALLREAVKRCR